MDAWRSQTSGDMMRADLGMSEAMSESARIQTSQSDDSLARLRAGIDTWLDEPSDWQGEGPDPRPAMVTWVADWNAFVGWNAEVLSSALDRCAEVPTR